MKLRDRVQGLGMGVGLGALVGVVCGCASALFLVLLDDVTRARLEHTQLIYALPVLGLVMGFAYEKFGTSVQGGNNLVLDTVNHDVVNHDASSDAPVLPLRMAPMVLVGTLLTHWFGGSAGREGTAVQMGASLADGLARLLRVTTSWRRLMVLAGVAGGFGAVFGTPVAGAVFALEVLVFGRLELAAIVPAVVAAVVGDVVTRAWGVQHMHYPQVAAVAWSPLLVVQELALAVGVAVVAVVFIESLHALQRISKARIPRTSLRMACGGVVVVALWLATGASDDLGLSLPLLQRAFTDPQLPAFTFVGKLVFTVVTLGFGFIGGEVTPLFVIGAALGNVVARTLGMPLDLAAALALTALFACASNTPLALSLMAVEIFGVGVLPHVLVVNVVATVLTGHRSIYLSQRIARTKGGHALPVPVALRDL